MPNQLALWAADEARVSDGVVRSAPPYPDETSAIIVSVSGGVDSAACAVWARQRWSGRRIILWHAYLHGMDWPHTQDNLRQMADVLGNCELVILQAVYELTGEDTPTGYKSTRLRRLHDVGKYGPATDDDANAILTLTEFWEHARLGMPPTLGKRYCTDYFKQSVFEVWCRQNRMQLGTDAVLLSGERWRESDNRSKVDSWQWREEVALKPTGRNPRGWQLLWARPVIGMSLSEVASMVVQAGVSLHPGYFIQGETLESMLDPERDERGRARLSCVTCIFSQPRHIRRALENEPEMIQPYVDRVMDIEGRLGRTWQQSGPLLRDQDSGRIVDR